MTKKKIILFNPSPRGFDGEDRNFITIPLSLLSAASAISRDFYEIILIDEIFEREYQEKLIPLKDQILLIGVTSMTGHQIGNALRFCDFIREINNSIPIIWGGYHASALPEQTLADNRVDIVCIGQGQYTLKEVVFALENQNDLATVKGIAFKRDGKIIKTNSRPITNINDLPSIPYSLIDLNKYICDPSESGKRIIGYISSQGCPWKCLFCAEVNMTKRRWSGLNAKKVVDDWEIFYKKYSITDVTLYDSNFVANSNRVKEIVKEIKKRNLKISMGFINARTDQICQYDEEFFQLLKEVNCTTFLIGAEGGSDKVLRLVDKKATIQNTIEAKKRLSKFGFKPMFSFMMGLEFDINKNNKEFNDLLNLIDKIREIDDNNEINIWNYVPYVGAELTEKAISMGYNPPSSLEAYAHFDLSTTHVPWVDKKYNFWLEMLRNMIFPHVSIQFSPGGTWEKSYQGKYKWMKKIFHRTFRAISLVRLKYRFFYIPIDYYLFKRYQEIIKRGKLVGQLPAANN